MFLFPRRPNSLITHYYVVGRRLLCQWIPSSIGGRHTQRGYRSVRNSPECWCLPTSLPFISWCCNRSTKSSQIYVLRNIYILDGVDMCTAVHQLYRFYIKQTAHRLQQPALDIRERFSKLGSPFRTYWSCCTIAICYTA